jgi:Leucine-rich repeat (LRR) protein
LVELKIGKNIFTELPIGALEGLKYLQNIDLSDGELKVLEARSLAFDSVNVRQIYLQNNKISDIHTEVFTGKYLNFKIDEIIMRL